jgi:hypothetical protein
MRISKINRLSCFREGGFSVFSIGIPAAIAITAGAASTAVSVNSLINSPSGGGPLNGTSGQTVAQAIQADQQQINTLTSAVQQDQATLNSVAQSQKNQEYLALGLAGIAVVAFLFRKKK